MEVVLVMLILLLLMVLVLHVLLFLKQVVQQLLVFSTRAAQVLEEGAGSTVTLSPDKGDVDFISFLIHYNGGTNTASSSYNVYVSKNGGFGFGSVGI